MANGTGRGVIKQFINHRLLSFFSVSPEITAQKGYGRHWLTKQDRSVKNSAPPVAGLHWSLDLPPVLGGGTDDS